MLLFNTEDVNVLLSRLEKWQFQFNKLKTHSFVANVLSKTHKIDNLSFN